MLIRVFLGWLRGEPRHCKLVAIPTLEEEDARRPSRERENLVGERTRIINRMKAALVRLGIRGFKPGLLTAPQKLAGAICRCRATCNPNRNHLFARPRSIARVKRGGAAKPLQRGCALSMLCVGARPETNTHGGFPSPL
jgi:transposase